MPTIGLCTQPATSEQDASSKAVHAIRHLHGAQALRTTLAETHGASCAVAAISLLTSLLLTCDAMPGVMNRMRHGGRVKFWTSQIVALSGQSESTQRRARSILRDAGVLEERRLTSGEISMRIDLRKLLAASPAIVGAPDDDVTVQEPTHRRKAAATAAVNMTDIRPYGPPELQTLSTTDTGAPTRMREAVGGPEAPTNDLEISERIDSGTEGPTTSVGLSTSNANATPLGLRSEPVAEVLCDSDRELVADVFSAFSKHPSIARSARSDPLRTQAAQATARRVAAMIREGVPVGALASATTHHLEEITRQTGAVVWSPTYCEPAYDRVHSDWTMRRAQRTRVREEQAERAARVAEWSEESVDEAVVDAVMARFRRPKPTSTLTPAALDTATPADDVRRELDALFTAKGSRHAS
jgi:hypothetical protein